MPQDYKDINFHGWEVVKKLGEGSFGGVYEIIRTLPDGTVEKSALKKLTVPKEHAEIEELRSHHYDNESITAHFREQMQDLVKEYSLMQKLGNNPNVVHCQDMQTIQHQDGIGWDIFIRMELLTPLKQVATDVYRESDVIRLAMDMCRALNGCHQRNIIHRDIKPENILVSPEGKYKLGDFGIAKISEKTATGTLTGTYSYMAPEIFNHQHYGVSADIYSLGLVMYWMMNERTLPFLPLYPKIPTAVQKQEAQERRFSGEPIPEPLHGSKWLKQIVLKACAFNPNNRYHSVQELAADIQAGYRSQTISTETSYSSITIRNHNSSDDYSDIKQTPTFHSNTSVGNNRGRQAVPPISPTVSPSTSKKHWAKVLLTSFAVVILLILLAFFAFRLIFNNAISASEEPPEQSGNSGGRSNTMQSFNLENDYFWGQNEIERKKIRKIIFTNEQSIDSYSWDLSEKGDGSITAQVSNDILYVVSDAFISLNQNSSWLFASFEEVIEIDFGNLVDTSGVKDMTGMFFGCSNLIQLDASEWDTCNVLSMECMFSGCNSLKQLNVSEWNIENVKDTSNMFFGCRSLAELDVSKWETRHVLSMKYMFAYCSSLTQLDISGWDKSNADTDGMFEGCPIQHQQEPNFVIPIVYDANGGQKAPSNQSGYVYNHEMTITHPDQIPVRNGYKFIGWLYENDRNWEIDQPGAIVSWGELFDDNPITYYAQWKALDQAFIIPDSFHGHSFDTSTLHIYSLKTPLQGEWYGEDLNTNDYQDIFSQSDRISLAIEQPKNFYLQNEPIDILYVFVDQSNSVIQEISDTADWHDIWIERDYHWAELNLPPVELDYGDYILYICFNSFLLGTTPISIR